MSAVGSFYRRGNSVTCHMLEDTLDAAATPRAPVQREEFMVTPPFTPSRWASDSPQAYGGGGVGITHKLDRVLFMFEEMKQQVERDSVETKEQLSILQDDLTVLKEKYHAAVPKAKKRIPSEILVCYMSVSWASVSPACSS